jgi:hypothetical protein
MTDSPDVPEGRHHVRTLIGQYQLEIGDIQPDIFHG